MTVITTLNVREEGGVFCNKKPGLPKVPVSISVTPEKWRDRGGTTFPGNENRDRPAGTSQNRRRQLSNQRVDQEFQVFEPDGVIKFKAVFHGGRGIGDDLGTIGQ